MVKQDEYVEKPKTQIDRLNTVIEGLAAKITKTDTNGEAMRKHKVFVASHRRKPDEAWAKPTDIEATADDHLMSWFSMNWRI